MAVVTEVAGGRMDAAISSLIEGCSEAVVAEGDPICSLRWCPLNC